MWWKGVGGDDVLSRCLFTGTLKGMSRLDFHSASAMLGLLHLDDYVARLGRASRSRVREAARAPGTARSIAPKGAKPHAALNACLPSLC